MNDAPYSFAALLGLPEQFGKGARRVNDALNWLRDHAFITLERTPGKEPKVTLLSELGDGRPYLVPGRAAKNRKTGKATPDNLYIQLPVGFWTDGLAATLSGRATAMLLVLLLLERSPGDKFGDLWASPGEALRRFDLSEDTRYRGFRELAQHGLVMVDRQPVRGDLEARRARRVRNVYTLLLPRSNQIPAT